MFECSLLRQVGPVEGLMREKLLAKQSQTYDWFLSEQVPSVVASFVHYFEADQRFTAATAMYVLTSTLFYTKFIKILMISSSRGF